METSDWWCHPEQRGPARDTWNEVCRIARKSLDQPGWDRRMTTRPIDSCSTTSSTSSKELADQSDEDVSSVSRSFTPMCSVQNTDVDSSDRSRPISALSPHSTDPLPPQSVLRNRARRLAIDGSVHRLCQLHGGVPWISNTRGYEASKNGLHEEILDFFNWMCPTAIECSVRQQVFNRLRSVILQIWPDAYVDYFGSFRTGLFLPTSDIDVVVVANWINLPHWCLAETLRQMGIVDESSVKVLDKATVPIVKVVDKDTQIRVDISFNANYGVQAAALISDFIEKYPVLKYLVLVLKQFLLQRDLNEVFTGGVGSYSLVLMVISFLQLHPRYETFRVPLSELNLGVLLLEFFELYGYQFNYLKTAIRIKDGGAYLSKEELQKQMPGGHRPSMLCIEDPLEAGNDIGRGSHGAIHVKRVFEHALYSLQPVIFLNSGKEESSKYVSLLSRIVRVTDEVISYREWLRGGTFRSTSPGGYMNFLPALDNITEKTIASLGLDEKSVACVNKISEATSSTSDLSSDEVDTDDSTHVGVSTLKNSCSSVVEKVTPPPNRAAGISPSISNHSSEHNCNSLDFHAKRGQNRQWQNNSDQAQYRPNPRRGGRDGNLNMQYRSNSRRFTTTTYRSRPNVGSRT